MSAPILTFDWSTVTEVTLARYAHKRPTEGLCLMEMVAWFAGEKHSDKPACACPVLGRYGIRLNDLLPDGLRDRHLKPLVPLLAGTRGGAVDERRRADAIMLWTVSRLLSALLGRLGLHELADRCTSAEDPEACYEVMRLARTPRLLANVPGAGNARKLAENLLVPHAANLRSAIVRLAVAIDLVELCLRHDPGMEAWGPIAVEGLRRAIAIGPHEGFGAVDLPARHVALRQLVTA